jgi:DNA-binding transcriptional LysR family regulator
LAITKIDWGKNLGRRLKLRDLHVFLTAANEGSMARAAAQLGVSQPVVTAAIADLEHAIGVRLFDRTKRGVQTTPFGQVLIEGGLKAFDDLKQTISAIEFLADPSAGVVRVGCPETVSPVLAPIFERLRKQHPRITFEVLDVVAPTFDLPQLRDRSLDLAVLRVFWAPPHPEGLKVEELAEDETVVVVDADSALARKRKVDLTDLADQDWVLPPAHTTNSLVVMEAFRARGLAPPKVSYVTFSVALRTSLLATGKFVSVLPRTMVNLHGKRLSLKMLPVQLAPRKWPMVLVTLKDRTLNPAARTFIDFLRTQMAGTDQRREKGIGQSLVRRSYADPKKRRISR